MIIEFETAKLAKEVGFDLPVHNHFNEDQLNIDDYLQEGPPDCYNFVPRWSYNDMLSSTENLYLAPTQSELQTWLRDTKKIFIKIDIFTDDNCEVFYDYAITDLNNPFNNMDEEIFVVDFFSKDDEHKTYEKALEAGLIAGLKLINNEKP